MPLSPLHPRRLEVTMAFIPVTSEEEMRDGKPLSPLHPRLRRPIQAFIPVTSEVRRRFKCLYPRYIRGIQCQSLPLSPLHPRLWL